MIENKLDKTFGPSASFAGYFFIFAGILATLQSLFGILLIALGVFIGLSRSGIMIDPEKNLVKYYTRIFFFFKQGKWERLSNFEALILLKNRNVYTAHSRSNRTVEIKGQGYFIYLLRTGTHLKIPVMKCNSLEEGRSKINEFSEILTIPVLSE